MYVYQPIPVFHFWRLLKLQGDLEWIQTESEPFGGKDLLSVEAGLGRAQGLRKGERVWQVGSKHGENSPWYQHSYGYILCIYIYTIWSFNIAMENPYENPL